MELMRKVVREQGKTLVMVTHDNHLAGFADRIFHIIDGKIVKIENPANDAKPSKGGRGRRRR
jgi:putative ABC transport system ATP-binding protein